MPGHELLLAGLFPVHQPGDIVGNVDGPWFNWKGKRVECDWINWNSPDGRRIRVGIVIPCPQCEYPLIVPQIRPEMYQLGDEGELAYRDVLQCPSYWNAEGEVGMTSEMRRCGFVGVVRQGLAHHPQCQAIHKPHCPHPTGGACVANCRMSRSDGHKECSCGATQGPR
jgi:hypothetical protein